MITRKLPVIIAFSIVTLFSSCKTEEVILHGDIKGLVTDAETSEPIQAAKVKLNPSNDTTSTANDGTYFFEKITPGDYEIQVSKFAYATSTKNVTVTPAEIQKIDFTLNKIPYPIFSEKYLDFGFDSILKSFTITNTGAGELKYSLTTSQNWITVNPAMGTLTAVADSIKVTINRTGLSENKHIESIEIISNIGQDVIRDTIDVLVNGVIDQDTNYYGIITIGTQTWLRENLNTGDMIWHYVEPTDNGEVEKYCYDDNPNNCSIYGGLYTWHEMMDYNPSDTGIIGTTQGICPAGWHIPSDNEWNTLIYYLGGESIAGAALKEADTTHWQFPNVGATNETGFTALPGGEMGRDDYYSTNPNDNKFVSLEIMANFWASSINFFESDPIETGSEYFISYNETYLRQYKVPNFQGVSVRCIKDP